MAEAAIDMDVAAPGVVDEPEGPEECAAKKDCTCDCRPGSLAIIRSPERLAVPDGFRSSSRERTFVMFVFMCVCVDR